MKTTLVAIGKTDDSYIRTGIDKYVNRLRHYISFDVQVLPDVKNKNLSAEQQKLAEAKLLLPFFAPSDIVVLLDEGGQEFTSRAFADFFTKQTLSGRRNLFFVIGGPYGFASDVYQRANAKISLSRMTFSHQMVRLIFLEQLYRAQTIIKGEPYHHD